MTSFHAHLIYLLNNYKNERKPSIENENEKNSNNSSFEPYTKPSL